MRRWSTSFIGFLIPNSLVTTWSPEHNYLGGRMPVFQCYVLLFPTVGHPGIFLNNPPFFQHLFSCRTIYQTLDKELTRSISRIQAHLLSTWDPHPVTIWTTNPIRKGIFPYDLVSWELCSFQTSECLVKTNPGYIMISMCFHTQPQIIIPVAKFT